ncbi:hypothetical protein SAMN05421684_4160 [Asanoa ishikariensis]|uniref:PH domain-containing protein n=1 Tax=Asanoa ishikariensis TaxID=137265 RepID=A0A1H3RTK8_9ACTN|nr:hypothetical protein [Asanoa ishikariensis]SDZ28581.1 hypothetical protein SAMN05421684_4160 [Asanoa ishikariensis]
MRTPVRVVSAAQEPLPGDPLRFRPTWRQALGRGMWVGVLVSGALALTGLAAVLAPEVAHWLTDAELYRTVPPQLWWLLVLPVPVSAVLGLLLRGRVGADLDAAGAWAVPGALGDSAPWHRVVEVRMERRGRRTVVALPLLDGSIVRLRAPYDGHLLGRDPDFERKQFRIRLLWETHRYG